MTNFKWLTLNLILVAGIAVTASSAQADGSIKKSRLCRHLKMIYLLNNGSDSAGANEVKEKYGEMACGQLSLSSDGNKDRSTDGTISKQPTLTAVTKMPGPTPTITATDTAQ